MTSGHKLVLYGLLGSLGISLLLPGLLGILMLKIICAL